MAYMNQERKATIAANLKPVLKAFGVKGSLSVRNHSTIVLTLTSGKVDFVKDFIAVTRDNAKLTYERGFTVNPYWFQEHYTGDSLAFLHEVIAALKSAGWYDNSDVQSDYFNTAYYFDINVGKWDKPYILEK